MIQDYLSLIRFSHTVFALPFAGLASVWALVLPMRTGELAISHLGLRILGILLCMVAARSAAMAFNRLVDQQYDSANPRTASRHLPAGILTRTRVWGFFVGCCLAFIVATFLFLPNRLPVYWSIPVLAWICAYSYAKRFTWGVHLWLGSALALSPICAWVALRGEEVMRQPIDLVPAFLLGMSVALWVSGFDIIYSCQDAEFDRSSRLHSLPARFGLERALQIAALLHVLMWFTLASIPWLVPELNLGWVYWGSLIFVAGLLIRQHWIVDASDLSRVNEAFFTLNAIISFGLTSLAALDSWIVQ